MFYSTILLAAAASLASAQVIPNDTNPSNNINPTAWSHTSITIDPNSIDMTTKLQWCAAQTHTCPDICGGQAMPNNCDPTSLNYTCTCTDGSKPNISDYTQTVPFYECQAWQADCVAGNPNDLDAIAGCHSVTCGARNASADSSSSSSSGGSTTVLPVVSGSATASASASSTSGSGSSGSSPSSSSSGSAASASSTDSAAMALHVAKSYGTGILATGMLAFFGLAL